MLLPPRVTIASSFSIVHTQSSGVFFTPTLAKRAPVRFLEGSARRGNLGGRGGAMRGGLPARTLLRNLAREEKLEEEEEKSDSDMSISSDLGPMFNKNL